MVGLNENFTLKKPKVTAPLRLLIVRAPYYKEITDNLLSGATAEILAIGGEWELVDVPGALEIPTAIGIAGRMKEFDGYVALGCVIRGETTHYELVCKESSRGITLLGLQGLCIGNGILTVENKRQAEVRADPNGQNKGSAATLAAVHLIAIARKWRDERSGVGFATRIEP